MTPSENIFKWIEKNKDFFKVQAICKKVGIDKGNFSKYKTSKSIPEKYIGSIINLITPLGFKNEVKVTDYTKPTNILKPFEQPKTNFTINTIPEEKQHPKFQKGDPREGSNGFYLKYGVFTYDEL